MINRAQYFQLVMTVVLGLGSLQVQGQKIGEVPKSLPSMKAPRGETLEAQSTSGQPFWYRLPKKISKSSPPALILMLHGTGGNQGWAFWNYGVAQGNFRPDDIVVSPEGVTPGQVKSFNFVQGDKDGDQIVEIIKQFRRAFPIGKVYLYGHSQGAFFCYWFAGAHPNLIDGIVAHAGNVLNVAHPALAKKKVGIVILHGKVDAVVTVACAYRTHKIYQKEGYSLLKLEVVEGLTAQSGHWPLPQKVKEMIAWLDQVTANTPAAAHAAIKSILSAKTCDLEALTEASSSLAKLLKKYRGDDREQLAGDLATVEVFVENLVVKHGEKIRAVAVDEKGMKYPSHLAHFRQIHLAFADRTSWKKQVSKLISAAKRGEKVIAKASSKLWRKYSKKTLTSAISVLEKNQAAPSLDNFHGEVERANTNPPKGFGGKIAKKLETVVNNIRESRKTGVEAMRKITAESVGALRKSEPSLFLKPN